jgi:N-acetylglucosaminyldiphosphoundecaprenol N-acetyl-beta-D-mannosaminyltransferase
MNQLPESGRESATLIENLSVFGGSSEDCTLQLYRWAQERGGGLRYFACVNPHSVEVSLHDAAFKRSLEEADLLVPDGVGVVLALRFLGQDVRERITGSDIFSQLNSKFSKNSPCRAFLLGSSEAVLLRVQEKMSREFQGVEVVGTFSPPYRTVFSPEENDAMVNAVNEVRPDVVWVSMTAPKQEKWIHANRHFIQANLICPVGAVFEFYAGTTKRPSSASQALGLEWLVRLARNPKRLWRRTFVSAPRFLLRVVWLRFKRHSQAKRTP